MQIELVKEIFFKSVRVMYYTCHLMYTTLTMIEFFFHKNEYVRHSTCNQCNVCYGSNTIIKCQTLKQSHKHEVNA